MSWTEKVISSKGKFWLMLYWFLLQFLMIFASVIWYGAVNYSTVIAAVAGVGIDLDVFILLSILWILALIYVSILFVRACKAIHRTQQLTPRVRHKLLAFWGCFILGGLYIGVYFISNEMISVFWLIMLDVGVILLIEMIIFILILVGPFVHELQQITKKEVIPAKNKFATIVASILIILFIILPYIMVPANVLSYPLPKKPQCIAHRASGYLGPENTVEAAIATHSYGAIGAEIDITISRDGVPFLMHDDALFRTTDVVNVFPGREWEPADNFTIAELKQLNQGKKFLSEPNGFIAHQYLNDSMLAMYENASITTLAELIAICEPWDWILDLDMKGPALENHPYKENFTQIVMEILNKSSLTTLWSDSFEPKSSKMVYYSTNYDLSPSQLTAMGYRMILIEEVRISNDQFRQYPEANFPLYAQIIDDPISYSKMWCLGVDYVMTDSAHLYFGLSQPVWYINSVPWYLFWICLDGIYGIMLIYGLINNRKHKKTN